MKEVGLRFEGRNDGKRVMVEEWMGVLFSEEGVTVEG